MVQITASNVAPMAFTGGKTPIALQYRTQMVAGTYRVVPRIEVKDSPVVFVGYGIVAPEKGWNDYAGLDVHGKTVVILVNDPDWQSTTREGLFEGRAMTYYGRWTYKFEEAARQGATAAIIVHDTEPAAYPFAVVQSSWTGPQLELDEKGDHMDQSKMSGWIQKADAQALSPAPVRISRRCRKRRSIRDLGRCRWALRCRPASTMRSGAKRRRTSSACCRAGPRPTTMSSTARIGIISATARR